MAKNLSSNLNGSVTLKASENIFSEGNCSEKMPTVKISQQHLQKYQGAGAALTEATAILLSEMTSTERESFLQKAFGSQGMKLNFLRVPIGATDFSPEHVSCDDLPSPQHTDPDLKSYDFEKCAGNLVKSLKQILRINPQIHLIASPWSAPAWMKTSGSLIGGSLKKENNQVYAKYLVRFLEEMKKRGIYFEFLTVENEPLYDESWARYPWMHMEAAEQTELIGKYLGPLLVQKGFARTKILAFDHNWDHTDYPKTVLQDPIAARYVSGIAFHCYLGSPEAMLPLKKEFPDKEFHMTECAAGGWIPSDSQALSEAVNDLIIRNFKSGSQSLTYWNLLLDENHGPKNGGCENCRGILNMTRATHKISGSPEATALMHLTSAVDPGAFVVSSSELSGLSQIAFENPNGDLAWIALNSTEADISLQVQAGGHCSSFQIPAFSLISTRVSPHLPSSP